MSSKVFKVSVGFLMVAVIFMTASLYVSERYMQRQQQFAASGNIAGSLGAASAAARFDPFSPEPFQTESSLFDNRDRARDAENAMERAAARDPNNFVVRLSIGNLRFGQEDFQGAEEAYRLASEINPMSSAATDGIAQSLLRQGDLEGARKPYEKLYEDRTITTVGLYNLGRIYVRTGMPEEGFRLINRSRNIAERELPGLPEQLRPEQRDLIDSMELAAVDALVVQREYDRAYRLVSGSSSSQAAALAQLIATDPEGYRQSVIDDKIY